MLQATAVDLSNAFHICASLEIRTAHPSLYTTVPAHFVLLPSVFNSTAYSSVFLNTIITRVFQLTSKNPAANGIPWLVATLKNTVLPYLKPDELSPQTHAHLLKQHFKINIPSTLRSSTRPLTIMLYGQVSSHLSHPSIFTFLDLTVCS